MGKENIKAVRFVRLNLAAFFDIAKEGEFLLFHSFASQTERREFGGGDFLEFAFCKLNRDMPIEELVSNDAVASLHWSSSSLYLCGDDWNEFCDAYGHIITNATYANLETGYLDECGTNYFSPEQMQLIMKLLQAEKPKDYQPLLNWLHQGIQYNGFYVLGL